MSDRKRLTGFLVDQRNPESWRSWIATLDGVRSLPGPVSRDLSIPGRDGVIPSLNDDMSPGQIYGNVVITSNDSSNQSAATNSARLEQFQHNLDEVFARYLPSGQLIDFRMPVGPDDSPEFNLVANPRMDAGAGTTPVRWNIAFNPSFESLVAGPPVRTNLNPRPNFSYGSVAGYTSENCDIGPAVLNPALKFSTLGNGLITASVLTAPITIPTAPASRTLYVQVDLASGQRFALAKKGSSHKGLDDFAIRARYSTNGGTTWTNTSYRAASWNAPPTGSDEPDAQFRTFGWSLSIPGTANRVKAEVLWFPRQREVFDTTTLWANAENWLVELASTPGPYFDGDTAPADLGLDGTTTVGWSGTPGASQSTIAPTQPLNWLGMSGVSLTPTSDSFTTGVRGCAVQLTADVAAGDQLVRSARRAITNTEGWGGRTLFACALEVMGVFNWQPALSLRVGCYSSTTGDDTATFLGYAADAGTGNVETAAVTGRRLTFGRMLLENVTVVPGTVAVAMVLCAGDDISAGVRYAVDSAIIQPTGNCDHYFDGNKGKRYVWTGTQGSSTSEMLGAGVSGWRFTGGLGSLTDHAASPVGGIAVARFQASGTPTSSMSCQMWQAVVPVNPVRFWQAGVHVYGGTAVNWVGVAVYAYSSTAPAASTLLPSSDVTWTKLSLSDWSFVTMPPFQAPAGTKSLVGYIFLAGGGSKPTPLVAGDVVYLAGGMLTTVDGQVDDVGYFDDLTPGCRFDANQTGKIKRLSQHRQAMCKLADSSAPTVTNASDGWFASMAVNLEIPGTWWQSTELLTWQGECDPNGAITLQVTNLSGSTARIEDAVIVVQGPAVNPRVTDPVSGAWVQLDGTLTSNQAWRIDAQARLSGIGAIDKGALSDGWHNVLDATNYRLARAGTLLPLAPNPNGHVFVRVANATGVEIVARQKWA